MKEPAHWKHLPVGFGDRVIIRRSPETEATGLADRTGVVFGITTVSVTGVAVVGRAEEDTAINVFFEETGDGVWFSPSLVELVDHNPGATFTIAGVPKKWSRDAFGNWVESSRTILLTEWPTRLRRMFRRLLGR